jgi:hypothetical protein
VTLVHPYSHDHHFRFEGSAGFGRIDGVVHELFLLLGNVSVSLSDINTYSTVRSEFVPGSFGPRGKGYCTISNLSAILLIFSGDNRTERYLLYVIPSPFQFQTTISGGSSG